MSQEPADARYLYEQIYTELKEEILSGRYHKGDWFPPERVLKDRFNTTHLTVRNALAKLVLEGYIERYSGKGTVVIYARGSASVPRKTLRFPWAHLILRDLDEPGARLLESLESQMRKLPLAVRISCHHGDVLLAQGMVREARESGALVILEPAGSGAAASPDEAVTGMVLLRSPEPASPFPQVIVDDVEAGRKAARRFLDSGHGVIALLAESGAPHEQSLRQGLLEELAARRIPAEAIVVQSSAPGVEGGAASVRAVLVSHSDCRAFLCTSDEIAAGAARAGADRGGAGLSVIGYGNTRLARALPLSSLDPGFERLAERVVACVREGMSRGTFPAEISTVVPELVIRG
jgi:DNA-binding LacI/PurR family transcriptional regulator/DNA-binding transcriptional regulator YhcF (GntR family)